ncbi:MAG: cell surface protein SprA [Tannerellaceae bacterium]|jgi:cell surface protein SprA|nr:cell surface protein SprA [Tannerellaceae bacterium]
MKKIVFGLACCLAWVVGLFAQEKADSLPRYPIARTSLQEYADLVRQSPMDLHDPENITRTVEYDLRTGMYVVHSRVGDMEITTPVVLTPQEYSAYTLRRSLHAYFRQKNDEGFSGNEKKIFDLSEMQFDIGAAEKLFGQGGVKVKTQGSAEISLGLKSNSTRDPSLPERARSHTFFSFDENIQLSMQASVGDKLNFDMNYNTQTSFDFDSKKLKLAYQGKEDEIIKHIEAGNVSMTTSNSLINGGAALFGLKTDMQFGKLRVNTLFAQQESESMTVSSRGGVQTKPFEIKADQYDENRHFFLAHYFYDTYDQSMAYLPSIASKVNITRIEVWITNKRSNYDQARNIIAFADLGENSHISNSSFTHPSGAQTIPTNEANTLYSSLLANYTGARNISQATQVLSGVMSGGRDFEKIESARRLNSNEYSLNRQLGYISLLTQLQADEVLAVAFEYQYGGAVYQVGEFSTDNADNASACLYVKLIKGTTASPLMPVWKLMMKNVYALTNPTYSYIQSGIQREKFRLDILYQSDTTGTYLSYLPESRIQNEILLRVMNLDRLDTRNEPHADGFFDFVSGFTVLPESGRIIFPVIEPFGSHLRARIGDDAIADKYVYQELYDSTLTFAQQVAEKNKFILRGEYKSSSGAEIQLDAMNVAKGSVRVTAGGTVLTENTDYTVDYIMGTVTILNEGVISSNTPVSVTLENQSMFNMQRKTMLGVDVNYDFSKDFILGATVMHMSEMPLIVKTSMGGESIKNTLWGLNASYKGESQWLTNLADKLPLLTLTRPSQISFKAEFAHLIAGHYQNKYTGEYSYLDDFESSQIGYNLQEPYAWQLSSTPFDDRTTPRFPEATLVNNLEYGKNRALTAWYVIDGIFTRKNSSTIPRHITKNDQSNHYARAVEVQELFPNREQAMSDASLQRVLNIAYYPTERGPYNLDADNLNPDGSLAYPEQRWGGLMRRVEKSDFETANIEFIEFWLLDPFIYNPTGIGGDLYINLGEVSEDILKDEKKFFENGLPVNDDPSAIDTTVWGVVPRRQSTVYAFDNAAGARARQDVGLNGLSSDSERSFPAYRDYINRLTSQLPSETLARMVDDPFSPINDPAGDNFHFYRGDDYDRLQLSILDRYKRYNGTEGNSQESTTNIETSSKNVPDVEDINQDNTLNETERYYEYRVSLRPNDLRIGVNHIADIRETKPLLANGTRESVKWYLFKIPIQQYAHSVGGISDFKTIRFLRMYLTDFREPVVLRFGTLELVQGEWRTYKQDLSSALSQGKLEVSSINIEENGDREPVNYVLPPGVTRMLDPSQPQLRQENEQALSMKVINLSPLEAKAIYKNVNYDLRQYRRLQLFTHAERFIEESTPTLSNGELSVFLRLGSDYRNNYYEYEVPLSLTPHGEYSSRSNADQLAVWPGENLLNIALETLTNLKLNRNRARKEERSEVSFQQVYSEYDPANPRNKISVIGNPSLAEVKTIMIGVRNNTREAKSGEIWINELRLTDFNESGGWAANAMVNVSLSDLGTVNMAGRMETAGFGGLDQSLMERRLDDYSQYNISTQVQLGKLFPEKAKVSIPLYYTSSQEVISPKYDPFDTDILLSEAIGSVRTQGEKDSIRRQAQEMSSTRSFSLNGVGVDIRSETPMPYDPANLSFSYSYSQSDQRNPEIEYETTKDYRGNLSYTYTPYAKPVQPFAGILKTENGYTKYLRQVAVNYLPANISYQTSMVRNYFETQLRDLTGGSGGGGVVNALPVSFSQNFVWDRAFSMRWNLTNNLNASFTSGTNARIEEPYMQVNKELNPGGYGVWRDSVMQSIRSLGTPMSYDQSIQVSYSVPLQQIPLLDWATANASYQGSYNWDRGAETEDPSLEIGNVIKNQRQVSLDATLNFTSLYGKVAWLKGVNQKFGVKPAVRGGVKPGAGAVKKVKRYEGEVLLSRDSAIEVEHKLEVGRVRVTAKRVDNQRGYEVKYRSVSPTRVRISTRDSVRLKVTVVPDPRPSLVGVLTQVGEYTARLLMAAQRVSIQYSVTEGMVLPGFRPDIGDAFGQQRQGGVLIPGLDFAFGGTGRGYVERAASQGWLVMSETNVNPVALSGAKTLNLRGNLEPIPGLRIDLTANQVDTRNSTIQYMYAGMPELIGGSYTMTVVGLGSFFEKTEDATRGYASASFRRFMENRGVIAERLEARYAGRRYPAYGFTGEAGLGGEVYDGGKGSVSVNSSDVLIPSFLAAYRGKEAGGSSLSLFPGLGSLFPNWNISYDGLVRLPLFKRVFKTLSLNHQYRGVYTVGSYSSYSNWVSAGDGLGFVRNIQTGAPVPSSAYEIGSVSLTQTFSPLLGANAVLVNGMTGKLQYNTSKVVNLNISSYQVVENSNTEVVVGGGYKVTQFNKVLGRKGSQNFSNDLNVSVDFSYRKSQALIRRIDDGTTQATSGNVAKTVMLSADYGMSRALTVRAFFDLQMNEPLVSNNSFPTSNANYGLSLRFSLVQ